MKKELDVNLICYFWILIEVLGVEFCPLLVGEKLVEIIVYWPHMSSIQIHSFFWKRPTAPPTTFLIYICKYILKYYKINTIFFSKAWISFSGLRYWSTRVPHTFAEMPHKLRETWLQAKNKLNLKSKIETTLFYLNVNQIKKQLRACVCVSEVVLHCICALVSGFRFCVDIFRFMQDLFI